MSCENVPTTAEIAQAKDDIGDFNTFMTSNADTFVDSNGVHRSTLTGTINKIDWSYVGKFADGVTFTKKSDFAIDANGTQWIYTGNYPFTATAGTVPSEPTYQVVHVSSHSSLNGRNDRDSHDFYAVNNVVGTFNSKAELISAAPPLVLGDILKLSDIEWVVSNTGVAIHGGLFIRPRKESLPSNSLSLTDSATGEQFRPALNTRTMPLADAFKDIMIRSRSGFAPRIVCYGDSNTRYYQSEGAANPTGPLCNSYGAQLDILCAKYPFLYGSSVQVLGFPGAQIQYGIDNFSMINPLTNYVVLGWGTNDIKLNNANMNTYLNQVVELFYKCLNANMCPIMLGIPWFSDTYGDQGQLSQDRLKTWNASLYALCLECGVPFIDTYNLTRSNPDLYFNETTVKRHYSVAATKQIAQKIVNVLSELMSSSGAPLSSFRNSFEDLSCMTVDQNTKIERSIVNLGAAGTNQQQRFEVMKIRPFKTTKFNGLGRFCLALHVSEAVEFDLIYNGFTQRIKLTPQVDNLNNYPIVRLSDTGGANFGTSNGVTIVVYSGNAYVRSVSFEDGESNTGMFLTDFTVVQNGDALPGAAPQGRSIFVAALLKTVRYVSDQSGWFDDNGLQSVGTTAQMNAQSGFGAPNGMKFWNTETSSRYKYIESSNSWVAF